MLRQGKHVTTPPSQTMSPGAEGREAEACPGTYRHFVSHQGVGVHDGHQLVQKVGLGHEELRSQLPHHALQLLSRKPRDSIPGFWLAPGDEVVKTNLNQPQKTCKCEIQQLFQVTHNQSTASTRTERFPGPYFSDTAWRRHDMGTWARKQRQEVASEGAHHASPSSVKCTRGAGHRRPRSSLV